MNGVYGEDVMHACGHDIHITASDEAMKTGVSVMAFAAIRFLQAEWTYV